MHDTTHIRLAKLGGNLAVIACVLRRVLPVVLVVAPAFALYRLILDFRVNIPFLDDWMFVHMFEHEQANRLSVHDFFVVQMEHRMAFVRAVILLLHKLWPTDYTKQLWVSWTLLTLTYVNIAMLLKKTSGAGFRAWWGLLVLAALAVFSPIQYRIVLWPMMFQVACPGFFLSMALVAFLSRWPLWVRWIVGILCASCATQTFATGILVWLIPLPLLWWGGVIQDNKKRWIFAGAWLLVFAVTMGLYFTNLKNEVDPEFSYKQGEEETMHHDTMAFFAQPGRSIPYVLRFLGQHLARGTSFSQMEASLWIGTASLVLFLAAGAYCLAHFRREDLRERLLPWLLFGSYSIGAGVLVSMGRLWASANGDNALAPRYVIHAVPMTVSLIALAWLISRDWLARHPHQDHTRLRVIQTVAIVILLALHTVSWIHGGRLMALWESSRLRGATNTLFYNVMPEIQDMVPGLRSFARQADELGLLDPPMLKDRKLSNFTRATDMLSQNTAAWTELTLRTDEDKTGKKFTCVYGGYACLPHRTRPADGIFFTFKNPTTKEWEIFYVAQVSAMPIYLMDTLLRDTQFVHTGGELQKEGVGRFAGEFDLSLVPKGVNRVAAWAFDYKARKVYLMSGFYEIDTEKQIIRPEGDDPAAVKLGSGVKKKSEK